MDRLKRKLETARTLMPAPEAHLEDGAEVGLIAYGSSHWGVIEARAQLAAHDSYSYFKGVGDLVVTGPTRTNVNDIRIVLIG